MPQIERNEPFLQRLVESFRAFLDESVVRAVASDYELCKKPDFAAAIEVLQSLSENVVAEENSGFNPSGVAGFQDGESQDAIDAQTLTSATSLSQHLSGNQETNSTSSASTSDPADATWVAPRVTSFNNDSKEDKILQLHAMFPELKTFDVEYALKKYNNDFQSALDHLLNMQYLEETGQQTKGIDGFVQLKEPQKRKGKGKGRKRREPSPDTKNAVPAELIREAKEQSDIGYIAERFNLTFDSVSETYYEHDCSSPETVVALLDQRISQDPSLADDDSLLEAVTILSRKYRQVPENYLQAIVSATNSIIPFSDDLAQLVNKHFARSKKNKGQKLMLGNIMTPLPRDEIEGSTSPSPLGSPNRPAWALSPTKPATASSPLVAIAGAGGSFADAIKASQALQHARREASASAVHMHRKGASHGLYRQAAAYYAEQARGHARDAHAATSAAADLLVDEQSYGRSIDLHGVSVRDGTRIARQRAADWWAQLGEFKAQEARTSPLAIITGLGRHSAGGVSQLRRSVAAALLQDGWKMEVGTGQFIITGRR
ncbi:Smr domain protein [Cordyceps fumosorosea ARSEF 2679]|uniref:Smr domain protein n=1 Tax=Cordyceps fumosorosea (strain ARSEF 2679) TaxID=1081104 RepID=A0A167VSD2_CORFA|nr:Smr domain protein [Cordyceps fumosorosea ARSEF 2679]OAA62931.1 Smr domain protein [Cordyceps fumosorosea ARSEF 2679]